MLKNKYLYGIPLALCTAVPLCLAAPALAAAGDDYPSRPVRMLVPNPPGGGSDAVARILAQKLTASMNQQFVVDNRAGGGGIIANETVARANADGYTLLLAFIGPVAISPALTKVPYDSVKDFAPVALVAGGQYMLVLHPSVPAKSLKDFVAYAKANPGKVNYASAGNGSPLHLAAELFKSRAGVNMVHVPYKGGGPATTAILSGEVQAVFGSLTSVVPQVKAGKLTPIGVTGAKRSQLAPEYPTIAELGYPGFEMTSWYGILLPARTPQAIVGKLNAAINEALKAKDATDALRRQGLDASGGTPAEFAAHIKSELAKWAKVVKDAGIKAD
ncbi:MAG: tripartite tricarboxylate transporter substrate binding protein [Burkholderiales bacterium]|nr:tripartite tricarboxylate transporter substrate binding protein [Burkholderiales bacterium]